MRVPKLTPPKDYLNEMLEYRDGVLYWRKDKACKKGKPRIGKVAGSLSPTDNRWYINIGGSSYTYARIVWAMHNDDPGVFAISYIDDNRLNTRIDNLYLRAFTWGKSKDE
jgi:hypothetical protein